MLEYSDSVVELLKVNSFIDDEQFAQVQKISDSEHISLINALKKVGNFSNEELMMMIAQVYGMETFDFTGYEIPEEARKALSPDLAHRYFLAPIAKEGDVLSIAIFDPSNLSLADTLNQLFGANINIFVSTEKQIREVIAECYEGIERRNKVDEHGLEIDDGETTEEDAPIIRLVHLIIADAFKFRGSDIHIEPLEKRLRIRYRIDGALNEVEAPPKNLQNNIISRLKIMATLDISEHRIPQDGRIQMKAMGKDIDLRVSCLPTVHGESLVMRVLDKSNISLGIAELGFFADDQQLIDRIIRMPDGIFLVTGPTGSGKTTSLYAFLNAINRPTVKIITAEDPVEYELTGINQVQIRSDIGMTFAKALRAMLRQAPNIIMVGEIRDQETGEIAINAALTGHMVFSTLHTNDAPSAITRLIDMKIKPFLIASSLRAVMAQRLVRRNCKQCAEPIEVTESELEVLKLPREYFKNASLMRGRGCSKCKHGYKGRVGLYEIFTLGQEIENLIYRQASSAEIREQALASGMRSLRDDGLRKAVAGLTTLSEVISVTIGDDMMFMD